MTRVLDRERRARPRRLMTQLAAGLVIIAAVGCGDDSSDTSTTASDTSVLGTENPATGTPVRIGFVTNDKFAASDNSIETPVAEATVEWINEYQGGIAGHPIELVRCVDSGDPSKATDCANQMIQDEVAAVVMGSNAVLDGVWGPLQSAGIPVFLYGASSVDVVADSASTFVLTNASALLFALPADTAKEEDKEKVTVVAIDVPAATGFFEDSGPGPMLYEQEGLDLDLVAIPGGTADMTPQMQQLVSDNPDGVVFVIGNDAFCIPAFNGLRTAGFEGIVTTSPQCVTDSTRTSVPGDFLEGIKIGATNPIDTPEDPSIEQYYAVLDTYGASDVDKTNINGVAMFTALAGFRVAMEGLQGDVTPESVIAAAQAMEYSELPGTGGLHFRCNGMADAGQPAVCASGTLAATLDAEGNATSYEPVGDTQIPG